VRLGEKGDFGPLFLLCRKLLILFEFFRLFLCDSCTIMVV
jgi:hypothetical protein